VTLVTSSNEQKRLLFSAKNSISVVKNLAVKRLFSIFLYKNNEIFYAFACGTALAHYDKVNSGAR